MTTVTIRISTSATGARTPSAGIRGAFGGTEPGASDDTSIEVTIEDLRTMGDAVVAIEGALPAAATAFTRVVQAEPTVQELDGQPENPWEPEGEPMFYPVDETLIEASVLEDVTAMAAGIDERAEKKRRKAQRKRAIEVITPLVRDAHKSLNDWDEDAKDIVKALEAEGIIR